MYFYAFLKYFSMESLEWCALIEMLLHTYCNFFHSIIVIACLHFHYLEILRSLFALLVIQHFYCI